MNNNTALNAIPVVCLAVGLGAVAYSAYQQKKLDRIMTKGMQKMEEDVRDGKFVIRIPR
jgi:uncharacterized membrane protein YebE (DUF533 family)